MDHASKLAPRASLPRREFLAAVGAALAGVAALPACASALAGTSPGRPLGIQLYTLRKLLARDVEGTLAALAEIGYREVELAGLYGKTAAEMRALLDRHGLRAPAGHVGLGELRGDALARTLADATTLGHEYVVCPWIDENDRTPAGYRAIAAEFDRVGEAVRLAGMRFAYHNHDFEFRLLAGAPGRGTAYDLLLAASDPALVQMELDLYWIIEGGRDPIEYFAAYPGRFPLVHVKDRTADGKMVDVGAGAIDWRALFARPETARAGIRHIFVEHDEPASPLGSARASFAYLSTLKL